MTDVVVGLKRSRPVRQFKKTRVGRLAVDLAAARRRTQKGAGPAAAQGTARSRDAAKPGSGSVTAVRKFRVEEYLAKSRTRPIDPQVVLYESFDGNGMLDSPL